MELLGSPRVFTLSNRPRFLVTLLLASILPLAQAQESKGSPVPHTDKTVTTWQSNEAVHMIGLSGIKEKVKGSLFISPTTLSFVAPEGRASIERQQIQSVAVGDISVEMGGTAGKITRAIIPLGGGAAVATVTHKRLSLLTVEFRDQHDALRGAVFLLPKDEAGVAQQQLPPQIPSAAVQQPEGPCDASATKIDTVRLAAITTQGGPVPAEYRVLLYEELVRRLQDERTFREVYRDGDTERAAGCAQYNVVVIVNAFSKGNAALRASTGPVGLFVGTTSLRIHLLIQDEHRRTLSDRDVHASQRGDSDSLNIGVKLAKSITKNLKKARGHGMKV